MWKCFVENNLVVYIFIMFTTFELYQNNMNNFKIFAQDWQLIDGCYKWKWLPQIFFYKNVYNIFFWKANIMVPWQVLVLHFNKLSCNNAGNTLPTSYLNCLLNIADCRNEEDISSRVGSASNPLPLPPTEVCVCDPDP